MRGTTRSGQPLGAVILVAVFLVSNISLANARSSTTNDDELLHKRASVRSLDPDTGKVMWTAALGSKPGYAEVVQSTPGRVYVGVTHCGSTDASFVSLDAQTGEQTSSATGFFPARTNPPSLSAALNVAVADGIAIVWNKVGQLTGLDVSSGRPVWQRSFDLDQNRPDDFVGATDELVLIRHYEGLTSTLLALDRRNGTTRWSVPGASTLPIAAGSGIVLTLETHYARDKASYSVHAIESGTGQERWVIPIDLTGQVPGVRAVLAHDIAVLSFGGVAAAYDAATGRPRWEVPIRQDAQFIVAPDAPSPEIIVHSFTEVSGIDIETGATRWTSPIGSSAIPTRSFPQQSASGEVLIVHTRADSGPPHADVVAIDIADGRTRWTRRGIGNSASTGPSDGVFAFGGCDTDRTDFPRRRILNALDARSGKTLWRAKRGGGVGNVQVVGFSAGRVIASEISCSGRHTAETVAVVGFDPETGAQVWRTPARPIGGPNGSFGQRSGGINDETISWIESVGPDTVLRTVNGHDGTDVWREPLGRSSTLLSGNEGVLVVTTFNPSASTDALTVYDRRDGTPRWSRDIPVGGLGQSIALGHSTLVVGVNSVSIPGPNTSMVTAFGIDDGRELWTLSQPPYVDILQIAEDTVVMTLQHPGSTSTVLAALDVETGAKRWERAGLSPTDTVVGAERGSVLIPDSADRNLESVDARSGTTRWRIAWPFVGPSYGFYPGTYADSKTVVTVVDDQARAVDARTGKRRWGRQIPDGVASIAVDEGRVYFAGGCTPQDPG